MAPLQVSRLGGPEELRSIASEWDALDGQLFPRTPFTGALWNQVWWKHYRSSGLMVRDELFLHVARDAGGSLLAVAPMMITRRPSMGPFQGRVLQCFGADRNITELRGIICRPEHDGAALRALSEHFAGGEITWDWIDWGGLREDGTAHASLARAGTIGWERCIPSYYLPLAPTWEEFRSRLGRNIKESLRKCYNSLKRDGHTFEFRVVDKPASVPAALEIFFRLHQDRAHSDAPLKHTNVFATRRDRAFLSDYALAMAQRGQLCLFQLAIGGNVVATRMGFLLGDELYLYYSGYDTSWAKYSVMTTVVAEAIKWAIERGLRTVSLSTGQDVSKTRWGPKWVNFRSAIQVNGAWRSRAAYGAYDRLSQMGAQDSLLGKISRMVRR